MKKSALDRQLPDLGRMDTKIYLQQITETRNRTGGVTETWDDWLESWAMIDYPQTGTDEKQSANQQTAFLRVKFTIRYRDGITEKHRVRYGDRFFDILSVVPIGRNHILEITAEKRE